MSGILAGIRVLDLSRQPLASPAARMLADHGAEVLRVADWRGHSARAEGISPADDPGGATMGLVLDLGTEAGRDALRALVRGADVLVEALHPAEMDALGLSHESLARINPRLVHAALGGPGDPRAGAGPHADGPASDPAAQDRPVNGAPGAGDVLAGARAAFGILAALRVAEATGKGRFLDFATQGADLPLGAGRGPRHDADAAPPAMPPWPGADPALAEAAPPPPPDPRALRSAFGAFATGVTVITTRQDDGVPRGFTANSFTSVSLDPPLLLVCLAKSALSCEVFASAPHFAVNILAEGQRALSGLFASRDADKFQRCDWRPGHAGVPLLTGALAQFVCARHRLVDAGDHLVLIGRIEDFRADEGRPLGYYRGNYFSVGLEQDLVAAAAAAKGSRIGAVLAHAAGVLLQSDADGRLSLPLSPGPVPSLDGLKASLARQGLSPEIDFVYAAFDDRQAGGHAIYYHGSVAGQAPAGYRIVPLADLAGAPLASAAEAQMLARFAADFRNGSFSIYHGDETTGSVRRLSASGGAEGPAPGPD